MRTINAESILAMQVPKPKQERGNSNPSVAEITEGNRHHELYKFIATLKDKGTTPKQAIPIAIAFNNERCEPPLAEAEVHKSVRDVYTYAKGKIPQVQKPSLKINTKTMADVMQEQLPPLRYIVEDLLPQGLAILAGLPKIGKSYLSLDLCLCVAHGLQFLGKRTSGGSVLYLALEDGDRRLQKRTKEVWGNKPINNKFHRATKAPRTSEGLMEQLDEHIKQYPDTVLIVIDTLQKVRKSTGQGGAYYGTDYDDADELKDFADKHNICVMAIHHFRKMDDNSDVFNRISGTTGLTGSADTLLALHKESRFADEAILSITSRDAQDLELTLTKDTTNGVRWKSLGSTEDVEANPQTRGIRQ